jgi:hypothetical protein
MRIGRFNEAAKEMVDDLFRVEDEAAFLEAQTTTVSVKCRLSTAAMLTVLSELFGQSRYTFTGEILDDFTADLFFNLPDHKRAEIATKADEIETELLAKQGITVESCGAAGDIKGSQTWRSLDAHREFDLTKIAGLSE